jgi:hypothetical protein
MVYSPSMFIKCSEADYAIRDRTGRTVYFNPLVLDERTTSVYTNGQCHALALELHRSMGYEIVVVINGDSDLLDHVETEARRGVLGDYNLAEVWCHAALRIGNNAYLDVLGVQTGGKLRSAWGKGARILSVPAPYLRRFGRTGLCMRPDYEGARVVAGTVRATYAQEIEQHCAMVKTKAVGAGV